MEDGAGPSSPDVNSNFGEQCADFFFVRPVSALLGQRTCQNVFNKRYWYLNFLRVE